jgi:Spy/CpxP family protein refolding chaperone
VTKRTLLLALFVLCAIPGIAAADPDRHGDRDRPGIERLLERHADRLHLDAATQERIRAMAAASRDQAQPLRDQAHRLHEEMRSLLSSDSPESAAVLAKADEIGRVETELQKQRLRTMLEIRTLLTPEQRREMVKIHEEMRAERGDRPRGDCWREPRARE